MRTQPNLSRCRGDGQQTVHEDRAAREATARDGAGHGRDRRGEAGAQATRKEGLTSEAMAGDDGEWGVGDGGLCRQRARDRRRVRQWNADESAGGEDDNAGGERKRREEERARRSVWTSRLSTCHADRQSLRAALRLACLWCSPFERAA